MESFCISIEDEEASESQQHDIRGAGAFRRFKDSIHSLGIAKDWHKYRESALLELAREWCEDNGIVNEDNVTDDQKTLSH